MDRLTELYREWSGGLPSEVRPMVGAGSNRRYVRLLDRQGHSVVGVVGTSREENHAFVHLARHFRAKGLPVPQVLAVSADEMRYLQEDLGGTSLLDVVKSEADKGHDLLRMAVRQLAEFQIRGAEGLDWSLCYPQPAFDRKNVMFDLNYFKYCFLKPSGLDFHEVRLEEDFERLADDLLSDAPDGCAPDHPSSCQAAGQAAPGCRGDAGSWGFMYRDFQARNVMVVSQPSATGRSLSFIDFQGGRRGPFYYDLASFLWQASAGYSDELRNELTGVYYDALGQYTDVPPMSHFTDRLNLFVLFRLMQVLGAYGFRGYFERKRHFLDSIAPALQSLRKIVEARRTSGRGSGYAYLLEVLHKLAEPKGKGLVVRVFSFSYKKGIPEDESGNGGGYVFDCRGTHNPGRYEAYKKLTGLDAPVKRFLEDDGEILTFLESVYKLADTHVARYMERGFTSLMFSFGCTGGQHRSVYCAQHLAEHIHEKFGIEVHVCHREQSIVSELKG